MKQLALTFLLASAALALATVTTTSAPATARPEQTAGAICCDEPPPQCWPLPCDPPEQGRALKPATR
jgi:hypothetical protein